MRDGLLRRLTTALAIALAAGAFLAWSNPVSRFKADLRADAKGFVFSLEYAAQAIDTPRR